MKFRIPFISSFLEYGVIFWRVARWKIPLFVGVSFLSGVSESFGISLVIPLLSQTNISKMDNNILTRILAKIFDFFHIPLTINSILLAMGVAFLFTTLLKTTKNVLRIYIKSSVERDWKKILLSLCGKVDYQYFIKSSTGFFSNVIVTEMQRAVSAFSQFCMLIAHIINVTVYLTVSFLLSWQITTGGIAAGILFMVIMRNMFRLSKRYSNQTSQNNSLLQENLIQTIQSFKYLKSTGYFKKLYDKLACTLDNLFILQMKQGWIRWILRCTLEVAAIWLVLGLVFYQVTIQGRSLSAIVVLILFFYKTMGQINLFQTSWNGVCDMVGGFLTVSRTSEELKDRQEPAGQKKLSHFTEKIQLSGINFAYGARQVLFDIDLRIKKNKTIALVGESGAGKSTLVDLITGVLKPFSGTITIDGVDYRDIDLESLRKIVGYVTQEIVMFNDTIKNNVSLWECVSEDRSCEEKVKSSLRKAHCEKFVLETPRSYDTHIGDRGVRLSVGQRQRLAIARELFKEPEILIFDEATSSLDSESEQSVQQSISELKNKKTIIIIAHRLSTVKNSDYVYVFDKGKIVEEGTFAQLYEQCGSRFRRMCDLQAL